MLMALVVLAAVQHLQREGVRVEMEAAPIAARVRSEVKAAVRSQLSAALRTASREIPQEVAAQVAGRLSGFTVEVGGFRVSVPPAAVEQVRVGVEEAVRSGLNAVAGRAELDRVADQLGDRAHVLVVQHLRRDLHGRKITVRLWSWLTVPVTVLVR